MSYTDAAFRVAEIARDAALEPRIEEAEGVWFRRFMARIDAEPNPAELREVLLIHGAHTLIQLAKVEYLRQGPAWPGPVELKA